MMVISFRYFAIFHILMFVFVHILNVVLVLLFRLRHYGIIESVSELNKRLCTLLFSNWCFKCFAARSNIPCFLYPQIDLNNPLHSDYWWTTVM